GLGLTHFNIYWAPGPEVLAQWHNRVQEAAERTRLGIPVTISSVPPSGLRGNPATSMAGSGFSQWPDPIGLAATRDEGLVREFADIAPRADLAAGSTLARHRAGRVPRGGDQARAPPDGRPRHRAAVVPRIRDVR